MVPLSEVSTTSLGFVDCFGLSNNKPISFLFLDENHGSSVRQDKV